MTYDRDFTYIGAVKVRHTTAARDYVCGCGANLITRWFPDDPHWRTVCTANPDHPADEFLHKTTHAYREISETERAEEARAVLRSLPEQLQVAILSNEKGVTCQSKD